MAKQYTGWAYVSGSGNDVNADGPVGAIQYHAGAGAISGSKELLFLTSSSEVILTGSLIVSGTITALNYDVVNHTVTYFSSSGDSKFGNSIDDLHEFTGSISACLGTASIAHLSGCSPITVHVPMQMQSGDSFSFNGSANTAKITNQGQNLDINSPQTIVLNSGNNNVSSSANISASAFWANGAELSPLAAGGGNGEVQYNDAGVLAGNGNLTYDGTSLSANGITILRNGNPSFGHLNVCEGTASILHLSGCSPIQVHAPMSSSYNISASAFFGSGAGLTDISLINLDAAGSDTNIQFNQNGEFAGNAGLAYNGTGSLTVSGNLGISEYMGLKGGVFQVTHSYGGKLSLGGLGNPYLQTQRFYATSSLAEMEIGPFNKLQIYQDGQISLSSSANADPEIETPAGIELVCNPGNGLVAVETNRVAFYHNTASLSSDEQEYLWSINSDHAGDEDDSAWIKLDMDSKEFAVGSADSIKLVALGGLQVDNAASTFNSAATFNSSLVANGNVTLGDASGDGVTWNAGSWNMSANSVVTTLKDGVDGLSGNGALMFFTGSGGDFMKFHTSGSAKGIVFPQETYLSRAGALSGTVAGPGSYLALDIDKKIILATPPAGGGGGSIFTELSATTAATTSSVMIGTGSAPMITLDVHLTGSGDPINLSNDTGGGEVVYFGTGSGALTAGGVYYLNSDGGWQSVDSSVTGSGHNQLLGIALGTKADTHGVLVRGYFDVNTYYSGSFVKGGPMYIQSSSVGRTATGGGYLSGAAPSAGDSYVRVVGYGTDTANVIYFNPDSTYVELV